MMRSEIRADNLGSLLRPSYLLDARHRDGPYDELRPLEDRAVEEAIALQEEIGLPVITDGEYRRRFFFSTIEVLYDGIDPTALPPRSKARAAASMMEQGVLSARSASIAT